MVNLALGGIFAVLFVSCQARDKRQLRNGVLLVLAAGFTLNGVVQQLSVWFPWVRWVYLAQVLLVPFGVMVLAAFLVVNGVTMLRREGWGLGNLLALLAGLVLLLLPAAALLGVRSRQPLALGLSALAFFLCCYLGCVFVVFLVYAVVYGRMKHDIEPTAVVILGSQLVDGAVPPLLAARLDKGLEIYARQHRLGRRVWLVPCGGQGVDEPRTEAAGMAEYLVEHGADPADVLPENHSTNTEENLRFAGQALREAGVDPPYLVATNNYHVLRAALLARRLGVPAEVVGAPTAGYYLPNAFLREFAAVLVEHRRLNALLCLPILAFTVLLVLAVTPAG
ncbi:YdcF family protein [Microlunatus panaciterrae]|uniref:Uncharacterized SAM-binding protein YcdF (DUF218 family) n=1 Tax=Microlunatus panaciterrae TaxID=400768 RepID=A0ABS2RKD3_9ACTN|nr:YdcF family protein [Microlunatus panaciterrae]MBM7799442.1 uncharacterized SAM-binding protein YcdF (DUF218 family) [Microlunatus panaciterrae]